MKKLFSVVIILFAAGYLNAAAPQFLAPEYLQSNGVNIDVSYYGHPFAVDWDGDGNKDLITGQFTYGNVRYYRNTGTNNAPVFGDSAILQAGGSPITLPYG